MSVSTFTQPNAAVQLPIAYKTAIDDSVNVMKRVAASFAPHQQASPDMTVRVDAGVIWNGSTLVEVAAQDTGTITAPSGNPRIDRVVVDAATGVVSVVTGSEAGSPSAPAVPAGSLPVCQILLDNDPVTTTITNSLITDERVAGAMGGSGTFVNLTVTGTLDNSSDLRLKMDVQPLESGPELLALKPVTYRKLASVDRLEAGFIAQDVEQHLPHLVTTQPDGMKAMNYIGLVAYLVKGLQDQQRQIDALAKMIRGET